MSEPICHLDLLVDRCEARLRLDGVPFGELIARGEQLEWFAPPLNPYLVGADDVVEVDVRPAMDEDGAPLDLAEARVVLAVVPVENGEPVAPGEAAPRGYAIRLRDIVRAGDVDALVEEMEPEVQAYAAAYDDADLERDEVVIEPLAEGRIWQLEKPDGPDLDRPGRARRDLSAPRHRRRPRRRAPDRALADVS